MRRRPWIAAVLLLAPGLLPAQASRDSVVFVLSPSSGFQVRTGKAGLFGFAGHEHVIRARAFSGHVVYFPGAPGTSRVEIVVPVDSLEVLTPPDTAEIRKVTAAMRADVLDVAHHSEIRLLSKSVTPVTGGFRLLADLTLVGETRQVPLEVHAEIGRDTLRAATTFTIKQTDFGIQPYRGGPAGTVRVADRVTFEIEVVALRVASP